MKIIDGDLLSIKSGIICHQVNCRGVMNGGIAKSIRDKWPHAYTSFKLFSNKNNNDLLGKYDVVNVDIGLYVVNCFTQFEYGREEKLYTNYGAIKTVFSNLFKETCDSENELYGLRVNIPYQYGCGLGGGSWFKVENIIDEVNPLVTAYRLKDK